MGGVCVGGVGCGRGCQISDSQVSHLVSTVIQEKKDLLWKEKASCAMNASNWIKDTLLENRT